MKYLLLVSVILLSGCFLDRYAIVTAEGIQGRHLTLEDCHAVIYKFKLDALCVKEN